MDICDNGHDEIVFKLSRYGCPLCRLLKEMDELNSFNDELQEQNRELRNNIK